MDKLLTTLRRALNYLFPPTRRIRSQYSGVLEVTWYEGRKVLNSAQANYSYGPLQRVLRYGLLFTEPATAGPILVLGLGGGSVVQTLREELQAPGPITAVELDSVIVQIAAEEFGVRPDATLQIVCADAFAWVATAPPAAFGLVVIDLFFDLSLPPGVSTAAFWEHITRVLRPGGRVLFNTLLTSEVVIQGQEIAAYLDGQGFAVQEVEVENYNRLLVLRKPGAAAPAASGPVEG